jgi:hypothetical protein
MYTSMYAAAVPTPLIWPTSAAGTVLMLSGAAAGLILAALVLRARRTRVVPPTMLREPVEAASTLRAVA